MSEDEYTCPVCSGPAYLDPDDKHVKCRNQTDCCYLEHVSIHGTVPSEAEREETARKIRENRTPKQIVHHRGKRTYSPRIGRFYSPEGRGSLDIEG